MAAAVPLPPKEQRRDFNMYTHFLPRTSLRGYSGVSLFSFSPCSPAVPGGTPYLLTIPRILTSACLALPILLRLFSLRVRAESTQMPS